MSFMFFTQQFNASRVKDAVKVMQESEEDEVSTVLKPVPKEDESVSIVITRYPHAPRCIPAPVATLDMYHALSAFTVLTVPAEVERSVSRHGEALDALGRDSRLSF